MQSRKLRELLGNPGYTITNHDDYIAIGSQLCHDLISVDKKTLKIKYALDTFRQGRECLVAKSSDLLLKIWDKLQELIDSGEIKGIIEKDDIIENQLPVYSFNQNGLIEGFTDEYGYPNVTITGELMYENTHFKTKKEAVKQAIQEYSARVELAKRRVKDIEEDLKKQKDWLKKDTESVDLFSGLLNSL